MPKGLSDRELEQLLYEESDAEIEDAIVFSDDEDSDREPEILETVSDVLEIDDEDCQELSAEQEHAENIPEEHDENEIGNHIIYKSKNGMQWSKIPYPQTRRGTSNIIRKKAGLTTYSSNFTTELEAFLLFFSEDLMEIIVVETNKKAEQVIRIQFLCVFACRYYQLFIFYL